MTIRRINLLFLVFVFAVTLVAQNKPKPDFTGSWILDENKSVSFQDKIKKTSPMDPLKRISKRLKIEHNGPEIKLTETMSIEDLDASGKTIKTTGGLSNASIFYTDKRGEINGSDRSISAWIGKKVLISTEFDRKKDVSRIITLSLSKDGKELSITMMVYKGDNTSVLILPYSGKKVYRKEGK